MKLININKVSKYFQLVAFILVLQLSYSDIVSIEYRSMLNSNNILPL